MNQVEPKIYPSALPEQAEFPSAVTFSWTPDRKPCQIQVETSLGRRKTLEPGNTGGPEAFLNLWCQAIRFSTDKDAAQALWDAVPDATPEERMMSGE